MTDKRWPIEDYETDNKFLIFMQLMKRHDRAIAALKEIAVVHYTDATEPVFGECCDDCPACIAHRALRMED